VKIFYSWQKNLSPRNHRNFIETALEKAIRSVNRHAGIEAVIDRDTADIAGAPDIADSIFRKIGASAVFVADVTIINSDLRPQRLTPNPNVLIELGYAAAALSWSRIIPVANQAHGSIEELPFDLRSRRTLTYDVPEDATDERRHPERDTLSSVLASRITEVLRQADEGKLRPRLDDLLRPEVTDQTRSRQLKPPQSLVKANELLSWKLDAEMLKECVHDIGEYGERLRRLPLAASEVLAVFLERAWPKSRSKTRLTLLRSELRTVTGLPTPDFDDLIDILDEHDFISIVIDDDDGRERVMASQISKFDWPFLGDVAEFCSKTHTPVKRIIVDLDFDLLD
jgi:hypothetical protein